MIDRRWMHGAATCLAACAAAMGMALGCHSDKHVCVRPDDALDYALYFARHIPATDIHETDRGNALTEVALAALRRGELDRAEAIVPEISTWQRGQICAELARALAGVGKPREAWQHVQRAEMWKAYIRARNEDGTMGWQAERLDVYIATARAALGDTNAAHSVLADSEAQVTPSTLALLVQASTNANTITPLDALLGGLATNRQFIVQNGVLKGLLAWAEANASVASNDLDRIMARVDEGLAGQPVALRIPLQYRVAGLLHGHGRTAEAQARVDNIEREVRALPGRVSRSVALGEAASYAMRRDATGGVRLLDEAAALLGSEEPVSSIPGTATSPDESDPKHPGRRAVLCQMAAVIASDLTPAYCRLAEVAANGGYPGRAAAFYERALVEAAKQANRVPRLVRFADVCARMAMTRTAPSPESRLLIARQMAASAGPP